MVRPLPIAAVIRPPAEPATPVTRLSLVDVAVTLRARERLIFPAVARGNILRGAFSLAFRRLVCVDPTLKLDCRACSLEPVCPWPSVFLPAPPPDAARLRLASDLPRPFVVKPHLAGPPELRAGDRFGFHLVLIGSASRFLPYFIVALRNLGEEGIGPHRGRFSVERVAAGDTTLHEAGSPIVRAAPPDRIDVLPAPAAAPASTSTGRLAIEFLTPTELKHEGAVVRRPIFHVLIRRIRDRLNALSTFFGDGPLALDFADLARRADGVRLVEDATTWREASRRSARTHHWHDLSGLVGRATFEGPLDEFVPLLRAAERIHVGRHAAFGNGWVRAVR